MNATPFQGRIKFLMAVVITAATLVVLAPPGNALDPGSTRGSTMSQLSQGVPALDDNQALLARGETTLEAVDYQAAPYFQAMSFNVAAVTRGWNERKVDAIVNRIIVSLIEVVALQEICGPYLYRIRDLLNDWFRGSRTFYAYLDISHSRGGECGNYGNGIITLHSTYRQTYELESPADRRAASQCLHNYQRLGEGAQSMLGPPIH